MILDLKVLFKILNLIESLKFHCDYEANYVSNVFVVVEWSKSPDFCPLCGEHILYDVRDLSYRIHGLEQVGCAKFNGLLRLNSSHHLWKMMYHKHSTEGVLITNGLSNWKPSIWNLYLPHLWIIPLETLYMESLSAPSVVEFNQHIAQRVCDV